MRRGEAGRGLRKRPLAQCGAEVTVTSGSRWWNAAAVISLMAATTSVGWPGPDRVMSQAEREASARTAKATWHRERAMNSEMRAVVLALAAAKARDGKYPRSEVVVSLAAIGPRIDEGGRLGLAFHDPWGEAYLYWSDGERTLLIALGKDRKPDRDYARLISSGADLGQALQCGTQNRDLNEDSIFYGRSRCRGNKLDSGPDGYVDEFGHESAE